MRDLQIDDLHLFARVVELGTLSAVARERDVPVSQVSRALGRIEKTCGARLLHRSTHGLSPTAEGETFLGYCARVRGAIDELEAEFAQHAREASGQVRVAVSAVIAHYLLVPSLAGLNARHPKLRVELLVDDRLADMARDGIDIAIRTGPPTTDTIVARKLGTLGRRLYAAPAYAKVHGVPQHPEELHRHRLIGNNAIAFLNRWPFTVEGHAMTIPVDGYWRSDSTAMTVQMALEGLGIARIIGVVGEPLVQRGLLMPVLAAHVDEQPTPIHAVTLSHRHRLPKIRACIDFWAEWFAAQHPPST